MDNAATKETETMKTTNLTAASLRLLTAMDQGTELCNPDVLGGQTSYGYHLPTDEPHWNFRFARASMVEKLASLGLIDLKAVYFSTAYVITEKGRCLVTASKS